jgi:hypothetical protein
MDLAKDTSQIEAKTLDSKANRQPAPACPFVQQK